MKVQPRTATLEVPGMRTGLSVSWLGCDILTIVFFLLSNYNTCKCFLVLFSYFFFKFMLNFLLAHRKYWLKKCPVRGSSSQACLHRGGMDIGSWWEVRWIPHLACPSALCIMCLCMEIQASLGMSLLLVCQPCSGLFVPFGLQSQVSQALVLSWYGVVFLHPVPGFIGTWVLGNLASCFRSGLEIGPGILGFCQT